jgi:perosamine synthetase
MPLETAARRVAIARPCLGDEEWHALREPLEKGWLTQGPCVGRFEKEFAQKHKVKHALATTSCTTALHLSLAALGIGPGDEVIVPAFTWVATANVVIYCGATPVLVDIDPNSYNIDPEAVRRAITPQTKAIIAVHLFGLCADVDALKAVAGDVPIIEDAACATGSSYRGRMAGTLGTLGCFSFHPRKSITTGEGGMITTNDDAMAERINILRNHGATISEEQRHHGPQPYLLPDFNLLGFNYRMTDLQGAVGSVQLTRLDGFLAERREWADFYERDLSDIPWLITPKVPRDCAHGWQAYVCRVDENIAPFPRNELMRRLEEQGISTRPGTHAVHMLGLYRERFGYRDDSFPNARDCDRFTIAIPLHNAMTPDDYQYVVDALHRFTFAQD